jgi:putative GTP pyrophosphokinase
VPEEPVFAQIPGLSRSAIDRAGERLERWWSAKEEPPASDEVAAAFMDMIAFRETFQMPLKKTVMGLRSMVRSEQPDLKGAARASVPVVQRLKRQEQMLNKLSRFPHSKLSNMGDIGGCRAVLRTRSEVDGVVRRIRKNWHIHGRVRDVRDEPTNSGYRALHVIVIRDGRRIEIQLRDPREHEWAVAVERTGARLGIGLKEGEGPDDLKEYFRLASQGMYLESIGEPPDATFGERFAAIREQVAPHFRR